MNPSLCFFPPRTRIYGVGVEVGGASGGPRGRGCAPTLVDRVWALGLDYFTSIFYIFQKYSPLISRSFRELLFLHKNNTMAIFLKTASVRVSSIQIMQVRVQNKGKSVWKTRYDGDLSRLGFVTPIVGEVSLGPLGNAHHYKPCKQCS